MGMEHGVMEVNKDCCRGHCEVFRVTTEVTLMVISKVTLRSLCRLLGSSQRS